MSNHHFISYSTIDAQDLAFRLDDALLAGPPSIPVWLDKRKLRPGDEWDEQIVEAIRGCKSLLFILTPDSVESQSVCKLGLCYADLGQTILAIGYLEQALAIAREIGNRGSECANLEHTGRAFTDSGEWNKAIHQFQQAIQIADEISDVQTQNEAREGLALACLYSGDLSAARTTAENARKYDYPLNNHNVSALLGLITLRQGDRAAAHEAFTAAAAQADEMLGHTAQNFDALDAKGLALCGLALCEENSELMQAAIAAYRTARAICQDAGIVGRMLRLFEALAVADTAGMLAEVRAAACGE